MIWKGGLKPGSKQLRAEAEAKLAAVPAPYDKMQRLSSEQILHELQVHQIELEMQNEELHRAHTAMEEARDRYVDLYEFAPVGYFSIDRNAIIKAVNLTGASLLGVDRKKLLNRPFSQFVSPADRGHWHRLFLHMKSMAEAEKYAFDLEMTRTDTSFHAHLDCLRWHGAGAPALLRITLTDISLLKQAEAQMRIAAIAFESQEGMLVTDANFKILQVNQAFTDITGYSAEESVGKTPHLLSAGQHSETFYAAMWESVKRTGGWESDVVNRRKNGEIYPEHLTITAVKREDGVVTNYVIAFTDITLSKAAADEIEHLAYNDILTGLPNRRLLLDRLAQALAASTRSGREGALLFIDLDNFKTLNDTLGHDVGDLLLQQVAERLTSCVREGDTVARLGGDEFVVMLEELGKDTAGAAVEAETIGNKILSLLNQPYQLDSHQYSNTPSIGITLFNDHEKAVEELLKQADISMYQAKKSGRNTIRFFDPQMQESITARVALETDMHHALDANQFSPYFQAQVCNKSDIVGAEVLIRWQRSKHGLVLPMDFIPVAEETGMILPIGLWILERACAQIKKWEQQADTRHLQLAVNVSARQFHQADFVEHVRQGLSHNAIKPDKLTLELTESLLLQDLDDTVNKMNTLRKIGVRFSLDDFGTGYSSLSYLTQLPFDQLKIDQKFVRNIGLKTTDTVIVKTIIGMAHNLGIDVIAEGVETEAQRTFLEQHGCPVCQGYLFSQPLAIEQFEALLH